MAAEFDTLFNNIVTTLEAASLTYATASRFGVYPDFMRQVPEDDEIAKVFVYYGGFNPSQQAGTTFFQTTHNYFIDMIAKKPGAVVSTVHTRGDEAAGIRLRYLIEQVRAALFTSAGWKLGMSAGQISNKPIMSLSVLDPSDPRLSERVIAAARFTLTVELVWEPTLLAGTALDSILVKEDSIAPLWSALIEP